MSDLIAEAENFERRAEKRLYHSWGSEDTIFDLSARLYDDLNSEGLLDSKLDQAADRFANAAALYTTANSWDRAGLAFIKSAKCCLKRKKKQEAARFYISAGYCYKETSMRPEEITCMEQAVNLFCDIEMFGTAACWLQIIADRYASEQNIEKAISCCEKAADFARNDESTVFANKCKLNIAQFSAQLERYPKAIKIYEELARHYSLEKYEWMARYLSTDDCVIYKVNGHLLNAGLCHLFSGDPVAITNTLEGYQNYYPTFSGTLECQFLTDVATAIDMNDVSKFTYLVEEFGSMITLDAWKTALLLRLKGKLKDKELEDLC